MSQDDNDRTIIKPMPGGRGAGAGAVPPATPTAPAGVPPQPAVPPAAPPPRRAAAPAQGTPMAIRGSGLNPLVNAATALLALVGQLRNTATHPDVGGLRNHVAQEVGRFEEAARSQGATPEAVLAARYCLCTLLDETVLSTPWGSESAWSKQSLLSTFHNETWGGEKFFLILERMLQEPASNLDMLELLYLCLSLGLQGKYRVLDRGEVKLQEINDNLFRTIRLQRGDHERDLSPRWRGMEDTRNLLVRYVPLWVVGALAGAILLAMYAGFGVILKNSSDPVHDELQSIGAQATSADQS